MDWEHEADTHRDMASTRNVVGIIHGTHLGLGFVFEVQLHTFYTDVTAPWKEAEKV